MNPLQPLYRLLRGGFEEVTVHGEISLVRGDGRVWHTGEGVGVYPTRSLLKPYQFLACGIPVDRWQGENLVNLRYAPAVGSVSATTDQVAVLDAWYRKGKPHEAAALVQVPPALPWDAEKRLQAAPRGPKPLYHMCFSKHATIVEACSVHGWDPTQYLSQEHPFHGRLREELAKALGEGVRQVPFVVDGCGLPTPALSTLSMARLMLRLGESADDAPLGWVRRLMGANPQWVGGPDRVDTRLMEVNGGRVIAKEGADGLLGFAVRGATPAETWGGVVKIASGFDMPAAALALNPLLDALGVVGVGKVPVGQEIEYGYRPLEAWGPQLWDLSPALSEGIAVWPGDVPFEREESLSTEAGQHLTLSSIRTTLHVGTHADGPNHFESGVGGIDTVPPEKYVGVCQVVAVAKSTGAVEPEDLGGVEVRARRVLLKTGSCPDPTGFNEHFPYPSPQLIHWLADRGVTLIGVDTPSFDAFDSKDLPTHHATQSRGVSVIEGLRLEGVEPGLYRLVAPPLKVKGGDAGPLRALLLRE